MYVYFIFDALINLTFIVDSLDISRGCVEVVDFTGFKFTVTVVQYSRSRSRTVQFYLTVHCRYVQYDYSTVRGLICVFHCQMW
jgi:hypothetical protein